MPRRYVERSSNPLPGRALSAIRRRGYSREDFRADGLSGLIVGVVAVPLSMALAIAAGAPPANGLYTAIVAGIVIALSGGSMTSVSGPTAAFVVLLAPVTAKYGLAGLLIASLMAGLILVVMGVMGLGKLVQFIPHPVTTGFTAGIALVIAVLQLGDFVGVGRLDGERIWDRLATLFERLPDASWPDLAVGAGTLAVLIIGPRLTRKVPAPLIALTVATIAGVLVARTGSPVATIESQFGSIPASPPVPAVPWTGLTFDAVTDLLPSALAIAMLGAIESLLCAVVADGMTGGRHDPDGELVGLGLGNIVAPFFGGFAATGAIARTATLIRAGGKTPIAVVVHSLFVLVAMVALAPVLGLVPMSAMAALLLVVAWNMSEVRHFARIVRIAPRSDVIVLVTCFLLTAAYDMVIAVGVGVVLAALLFMRRMAEISGATLTGGPAGHTVSGLPPGVVFYDVAGPLFFGAAEKALEALTTVDHGVHTVIIDLEDVPAIDATGLVALESAVARLNRSGIKVVLSGVLPQPRKALAKAGFKDRPGELEIADTLDDTLTKFEAIRGERSADPQ